MDLPKYAIVRGVPNTYDQCIRSVTVPIDVELAKEQHRQYCETLQELGLELIYIEADDRYPDCCYVEDTAIVIGDVAVISRMGAPTRREEVIEVRKILDKCKKIHDIKPSGTIEGGDVLRIDDKLFIGLSKRTNISAVEQVRKIAAPLGVQTIAVETKDLMHLKSDCTYLGRGHLLMAPGRFDEAPFNGYRKIIVPEEEAYAANCLAVGGNVIVSDGYPRTKRLIEEAGFATISLDMSEFRKGEGALTCLSVMVLNTQEMVNLILWSKQNNVASGPERSGNLMPNDRININ